MKLFIILVNWNGVKDTLACLSSIQDSSYPHVTTIVVDNGSSDKSAELIRSQYPHVIVIENHRNLGFAAGNNVGISYALAHEADAIFLLNNDTVIQKEALQHLVTASKHHPNAIIGAKILRQHEPHLLDHFGGKWNSSTYQFDLVGLKAEDSSSLSIPDDLDYVCGCALFAKASVFAKVGFLDPRFFLYWEESDFCLRAKTQGHPIIVCKEATLLHKGSASMVGGKPHTSYYFWRNRLLFIEKQLSSRRKTHFYFQVFSKEFSKLLRHYMLTWLHMNVYALSRNTTRMQTKRSQHQHLKASLAGCFDYFKRRFYEGPDWISKKSSS